MRIALVSNFWYQRGGLERVMLADAEQLAARGHEVAGFASAHALNERSPYDSFFPPGVDHSTLGRDQDLRGRAGTALRLFRNSIAVGAFDRFADAFRPDVVHQHGVSRQMSASVLARAHSRGIPTLLTLHDYSLRCPAGTLSRTAAPECLEVSCAGHRYDRSVRFKCVHGSRMASAIAATELLVTRALRRYERSVDMFVVPSDYVRTTMLETGIPAERLRVLANAIEARTDRPETEGKFVLGSGRLVYEKGFDLLVDAARSHPDVDFVIAGDGRERMNLERQAQGMPNTHFAGHLAGTAMSTMVREAMAVVVPSRWPEPFGMVVLEAWSMGRPVIVSARGALPELVENGRTGIVVEPDSATALGTAIGTLVTNPAHARAMGMDGYREAQTTYGMSAHVDHLLATYRELCT